MFFAFSTAFFATLGVLSALFVVGFAVCAVVLGAINNKFNKKKD